MLKRITFLEKREGMEKAEFSAYWVSTHARIAKQLPGVACYLQNHVEAHLALGSDPAYRVDGIVELWFSSPEVVSASSTSEVGDALVVDEPQFLAGLTGGPVLGGNPHGPWPYKLWILGLRDRRGSGMALESWAEYCAGRFEGILGAEVNRLEEGADLLLREVLRSEPRMPESSVAFGFATAQMARQAMENLAEFAQELEGTMHGAHAYLARERIIVAESVRN